MRRHIHVLNVRKLLQGLEKDSAFVTFQWIFVSVNSCATATAGSDNRVDCLTASIIHADSSLAFCERFESDRRQVINVPVEVNNLVTAITRQRLRL